MKCKLSLLEVIKFHKLMAARGHGSGEDNKMRNILCFISFITRSFTSNVKELNSESRTRTYLKIDSFNLHALPTWPSGQLITCGEFI